MGFKGWLCRRLTVFQDALSGPGEEGSELGQDRLQDGARFLSRVARRQTPTCQEDPVEFLQSVARLRVCLGTAASLLHQALSGTGDIFITSCCVKNWSPSALVTQHALL